MVGYAAFVDKPQQVSVGADVIEAMIVNADVREMGSHHAERSLTAKFEKTVIAGRIKLQERRAVLKSLRPLGPAFGCVASINREHGRRRTGWAALFNPLDALRRTRPESLQLRKKIA